MVDLMVLGNTGGPGYHNDLTMRPCFDFLKLQQFKNRVPKKEKERLTRVTNFSGGFSMFESTALLKKSEVKTDVLQLQL